MRNVTITLAGQTYTINELKTRDQRQWRKKLKAIIDDLGNQFNFDANMELTPASISQMVLAASQSLMGLPDQLVDLLFDYSPELAADKKRVMAECYESELTAALLEVVKLAFPFGAVLSTLIQAGRGKTPTSPS